MRFNCIVAQRPPVRVSLLGLSARLPCSPSYCLTNADKKLACQANFDPSLREWKQIKQKKQTNKRSGAERNLTGSLCLASASAFASSASIARHASGRKRRLARRRHSSGPISLAFYHSLRVGPASLQLDVNKFRSGMDENASASSSSGESHCHHWHC